MVPCSIELPLECRIVEQYVLYSLFQGEPDGNEAVEQDKDGDSDDNIQLNEGGKKDSFKRRQELLVDSGLAEVCPSHYWCILGKYGCVCNLLVFYFLLEKKSEFLLRSTIDTNSAIKLYRPSKFILLNHVTLGGGGTLTCKFHFTNAVPLLHVTWGIFLHALIFFFFAETHRNMF